MEPICWKVEKIVSKGDYNYAVVKGHPKANKLGYILEHRVVMENHLGRLLNSDEVVHHINHDRKDNRVENLEVMTAKQHQLLHGKEIGRKYCHLKCPECGVEFCKEIRDTFLQKGGRFTTCSAKCRGKLSRKIQLGRETQIVEAAISENILAIFKRYKGNSEVTVLQQEP
jgi:hypothetical protein